MHESPHWEEKARIAESIIAGGVTAIGIVLAQGPLTALAGVIAGVGSNWVTDLSKDAFNEWRNRWLSRQGISDQAIYLSLTRAFLDALYQLEQEWKQGDRYKHLYRTDLDSALVTLAPFQLLRDDTKRIFANPNQLVQMMQSTSAFGFSQTDTSELNQDLQKAVDRYLFGHDNELKNHIETKLVNKWIVNFLLVIKSPDENGTRAWRSIQILWQKSLGESLNEVQKSDKEILIGIKWLQDWAKRLTNLPATQREPTGLDALDDILNSIQNRVDGIKEDTEYIKAGVSQLLERGSSLHLPTDENLQKIRTACQRQVENVLFELRYKYDKDLYVHRAVEDEIDNFFDTPIVDSSPNCYLIVAPAGSGKTNLLCDLARNRVQQHLVVFLLGGSLYLSSNTGLFASIQSELEATSNEIHFDATIDSLHILDQYARLIDRDFLILIDAINEYEKPNEMRKAVEKLLSTIRGKRIKVVVTCRDYYWGLYKGDFWRGAVINELPNDENQSETNEKNITQFTTKEQDQALSLYLEHYQISGRPIGRAAEQCRHPLLLRFFCEAYRGQTIYEVEDIRLKDLFDQYWDQKLHSIAERMIQQGDMRLQDGLAAMVGDYLMDIAKYMLANDIRAIPLFEIGKATEIIEQAFDPRSIYGRIRDEFIILEEKEITEGFKKITQIAFVYEEFMEYVMARALVSDWEQKRLDQQSIIPEIENLLSKYTRFAQILGVVVYLAIMLKSRNIQLWSLLFTRGEQWQKAVFEAFRKLPEDQLDDGVFDSVAEILSEDEGEILVQMLDVLKINRFGKKAPRIVVHRIKSLANYPRNHPYSEPIRRRAILALANTLPDEAVPVLISAINDPLQSIRQNALNALSEIVPQHFISEYLKEQNEQGSSRNRFDDSVDEIYSLLASFFHVDRASSMPQLSNNQKPNRVGDAQMKRRIERLNRIQSEGEFRMNEILINRFGTTETAVLKKFGEQIWVMLVDLLFEQGKHRSRIAEALISVLNRNDKQITKQAILKLGQLGDVRPIEPLLFGLRYRDWSAEEKQIAIQSLVNLGYEFSERDTQKASIRESQLVASEKPDLTSGDSLHSSRFYQKVTEEDYLKLLISKLSDPDPLTRIYAVAAIGHKTRLQSINILVNCLKDLDASVRKNTVIILSKFGDRQIISSLIEVLETDKDSNVRVEAIKALRKFNEPQIIVSFAQALNDMDDDVRLLAVIALRNFDELRIIEPLAQALRDVNTEIRLQAAIGLSKFIDHRVAQPLILALNDKNNRVRLQAIRGLSRINYPDVIESLILALNFPDAEQRIRIIDALGKLRASEAVGALINLLQDHNREVCWAAINALGSIGSTRAIGPLVRLQKDASTTSRAKKAIKSINQKSVDGDKVVFNRLDSQDLMKKLESTDPDERLRAAKELGARGEISSVKKLLERLEDENPNVRLHATIALGKLGDVQAVVPLISCLKDHNTQVRVHTVIALGNLRDRRAIEPLTDLLSDGSVSSHAKAAIAMIMVDEDLSLAQSNNVDFSNVNITSVYPKELDVIENNNHANNQSSNVDIAANFEVRDVMSLDVDENTEQVKTTTVDNNKEISLDRMGILRDLPADENRKLKNGGRPAEPLTEFEGKTSDATDLLQASQNQSPEKKMDESNDQAPLQSIIENLKSQDNAVKAKAAEQLGKFGDSNEVGPLIEALKDNSTKVREEVVWALGKIGDENAIEPLISALKDPGVYVRSRAAEALGRIGSRIREDNLQNAIITVLAAALDDDWWVAYTASQALNSISTPSALDAIRDHEKNSKR
jgi:HEAT repeat protein